MKKKYYLIFVYISALIGVIFLLGGVKPKIYQQKTSEDFVTSRGPAIFKIGQTTIIKSVKVDSSGCIIKIGNLGTPIDGMAIDMPSGALDKETIIPIGYNDGTLNPNYGTFSGKTIVLNDDGTFPVPFYVDPDGKLHAVQPLGIDIVSGNFSFHTYHGGLFTWIFSPQK